MASSLVLEMHTTHFISNWFEAFERERKREREKEKERERRKKGQNRGQREREKERERERERIVGYRYKILSSAKN